MGYAYIFALVVGLGVLGVQAILGGKDVDADKDFDFDGDADADFDADFDADLDGDADLHADAGDFDADGDFDGDGDVDHVDAHTDQELSWTGADFLALFLSIRFWIFACLGFGLGGTILHFLTSVPDVPTAITASVLGLVSGLIASLTFQMLKRTASSTAEHTMVAIGRLGRVIVPVPEKGIGKIRVQLSGQSVDIIAKTTTGLRIETGDIVVIEDLEGEIAEVSKAPKELQQ
ncbi:MAG: hypothetical protein RIF41_26965 [Polyangiaceae bacterium]